MPFGEKLTIHSFQSMNRSFISDSFILSSKKALTFIGSDLIFPITDQSLYSYHIFRAEGSQDLVLEVTHKNKNPKYNKAYYIQRISGDSSVT